MGSLFPKEAWRQDIDPSVRNPAQLGNDNGKARPLIQVEDNFIPCSEPPYSRI